MTSPDHDGAGVGVSAAPAAAYGPGVAAGDAATNAMLSGRGPAAYAQRADVPDLTVEGHARIVPMRVAPEFFVEPRDPDPRGMAVIGADGIEAGVVTELWVDRAEPQLRYLETAVHGLAHPVLVPLAMAKVNGRARTVAVKSILARHFMDVPTTRHPDRVTRLEEDRITAYFASGYMYATPERRGPVL